jgi:acyl dehydratase
LTTDHQGFRLNYGLNRVRFPSPVLVNSTIYADATLAEFHVVPGGVQVLLDITVHADTSEKPVCVAQGIYRFYGEGL